MSLARQVGRIGLGAAAATVAATAVTLGAKAGGRAMVGRTEARLCRTTAAPPYRASDRAMALHRTLWVSDLHADSLLWGRDLLVRGDRGQVDVPRMREGNVALQVFAASTKSPRHLNIERNDDSSDDVVLLALALGWPPATWRRLLPRALYMASRADRFAARSGGAFRVIRKPATQNDFGSGLHGADRRLDQLRPSLDGAQVQAAHRAEFRQ